MNDALRDPRRGEKDDLLEAFERCTLPPESFRHREHLHVAWCYLRALPFEKAAVRFEKHLVRYAETYGASAKIDLPLTWAYLGLVAEALREGDASFAVLVDRRPDLLENRLSRGLRTSSPPATLPGL